MDQGEQPCRRAITTTPVLVLVRFAVQNLEGRVSHLANIPPEILKRLPEERMYVVLIETSGNQNYIFATNKLRENVGASELTYQIGTKYVLKAVEDETGRPLWVDADKTGRKLRENLLNRDLNPRIEGDTDVEVVVATSGKAILLVKEKGLAQKVVSKVTMNALIDMPGLTVHGAICEVGKNGQTDSERLESIHDAIRKVHHRLDSLKYKIPSNQQRFLRLPHVEPCSTSGLPASRIYQHASVATKSEELTPHSIISIVKQEKSESGRYRLEQTIRSIHNNVHLATSINNLEKIFEDTKWIAIIHADGNGLGEIFLNFREYSQSQSGREYVDIYRQFSIALDICTINAAAAAIENFQRIFQETYKEETQISTIEIPFIPLILGGDDLTVICDGEYALKFTTDFLRKFEDETSVLDPRSHFKEVSSQVQGLIRTIANNAFGNKDQEKPSITRLGMCAGVAIVKPHYPFHQAYELAEQLLKSAKQVKKKVRHKPCDEEVSLPCSAIDFHVLYDSSGVRLEDIRQKLKVEDGSLLYAKPYVVTNVTENVFDDGWLSRRTWDKLATRVKVMSDTEDDKRKLPNSQMHHIRESLHRGRLEAEAEVDLLKQRYSSNDPQKDKGFGKLLCDDDRLFFSERHTKDGVVLDVYATHFLDALDVVGFWKGFDNTQPNGTNGGSQNGGGE
jgi:hypothetical protein